MLWTKFEKVSMSIVERLTRLCLVFDYLFEMLSTNTFTNRCCAFITIVYLSNIDLPSPSKDERDWEKQSTFSGGKNLKTKIRWDFFE